MENKQRKYWTFKHKPGRDASPAQVMEIVKKARELKSAIMHFEYGTEQKPKKHWDRLLKVKKGDIIFLRGDTNIHAYGVAIKPRKKQDKIVSAREIIDNNYSKYNWDNYEGCIHFSEENVVFYQDLTPEGWGQRIDVDDWHCFDEYGIYARTEDFYIKVGFDRYAVLNKLEPQKGLQFLKQLKEKYKEFMKEQEKIELGSIGSKAKNLLLRNKNLILTGAPGTGKTYLAKEIAKSLNAEIEFVQFHPSYDYTDFVEGLRPIKKEESELGFELRDGIFKKLCKRALRNLIDSKESTENLKERKYLQKKLLLFIDKIDREIIENGEFELTGISRPCAPIVEIDYEKFKVKPESGSLTQCNLNNIIPNYKIFKKEDSNITWTHPRVVEKFTVNSYHSYYFGFIKAFDDFLSENDNNEVINAEPVTKKHFVLIIDEINRAEISKVFGELFFSIDLSYRGEGGRVKTQYSNLQNEDDLFKDGLYVPENVYIIGTMNDIDRSVESFDFAMRRRFSWLEIQADHRTEMWDGTIDDWKDEAQRRMESLNLEIENTQGLSSAFHIGPVYFLHLQKYKGNFDALWKYHIKGLLFEYLRGMPNNKDLLERLENAYNRKVETEQNG